MVRVILARIGLYQIWQPRTSQKWTCPAELRNGVAGGSKKRLSAWLNEILYKNNTASRQKNLYTLQ